MSEKACNLYSVKQRDNTFFDSLSLLPFLYFSDPLPSANAYPLFPFPFLSFPFVSIYFLIFLFSPFSSLSFSVFLPLLFPFPLLCCSHFLRSFTRLPAPQSVWSIFSPVFVVVWFSPVITATLVICVAVLAEEGSVPQKAREIITSRTSKQQDFSPFPRIIHVISQHPMCLFLRSNPESCKRNTQHFFILEKF